MAGPALVHRAVAYPDGAALADALAPALTRSVRTGHAVSVALDAPTAVCFRAALGDLAGDVAFLDPTRPASYDPFQLVARRAAAVAEAARSGVRSVFVAQNQEARLGLGAVYWLRLEAAFEAALQGLPATLVCAYRVAAGAVAPEPMTAAHRELVDAADPDRVRANPERRDPADIVAGLPAPALPAAPPDARRHRFDAPTLAALRRDLAIDAAATGLDRSGVDDLVYAVSEVATNAVEHGGGTGEVALWATEDAVVALVTGAGRVVDPFPGVVPPPTGQDRGRGLWLARALCDDVSVAVDGPRTRVRLTRRRTRTEPTTRQAR